MHLLCSLTFWCWQVTEWMGQVVDVERGETSKEIKKINK